MIGADFKSLVSSHDQTSLLILLVFEQPDITSTSLLPLSTISVELEELGSHLEGLLFSFFVSLGLDLLGQADDGFKLNIGFLFFSLLLCGC